MERMIGTTKLTLVQGDLTKAAVDAIVNAANSGLLGGGGVDGAIHRAGGPAILAECREIVARQGRLPAGKAVVTTGGNLPSRRIIHTVGPIWSGGTRGEPEVLASAYRESLDAAAREGLRTVAFPSISTGAYGYPVRAAARVALRAVAGRLAKSPGDFDEVRFVLFSEETLRAYEEAMGRLTAP